MSVMRMRVERERERDDLHRSRHRARSSAPARHSHHRADLSEPSAPHRRIRRGCSLPTPDRRTPHGRVGEVCRNNRRAPSTGGGLLEKRGDPAITPPPLDLCPVHRATTAQGPASGSSRELRSIDDPSALAPWCQSAWDPAGQGSVGLDRSAARDLGEAPRPELAVCGQGARNTREYVETRGRPLRGRDAWIFGLRGCRTTA